MKVLIQENLTDLQKEQIVTLWNAGYSRQLNYENTAGFDTYLKGLPDQKHFLLTDDSGEVAGWALTFIRDNERWFAIILNAAIQGKGLGTMLLNALKNAEESLRGWVTDHDNDVLASGAPYRSPMSFYMKNGFKVITDCRIDTEKMKGVKIEWKKSGDDNFRKKHA